MLHQLFDQLYSRYTNKYDLINRHWEELVKLYQHPKRHYHNLTHIQHFHQQLSEYYKKDIPDWVLFAMYYHDAVYNVNRKDNEEQSAILAIKILAEFSFPAEETKKCIAAIKATQYHQSTGETDIDVFTDSDLSILGALPAVYSDYAKQIRKEYAIYPDLLYNPGRKKVIQHFLNMPCIYKTDWFYTKYEEQARKNLTVELAIL